MAYQIIDLHPRSSDLTGQIFNRLTVIAPVGRDNQGKPLWLCICDCGTESVVAAKSLKINGTKSCGCLVADANRERLTRHGMRESPEYMSWVYMRQRCNNPNDISFPNYGGRGISICPEWDTFEQFFKDMGRKPAKNYSLDRVDNSAGYRKSNCRWATTKQQSNNRRSNHCLDFSGETLTISQWSRRTGIHKAAILALIKRGWTVEQALTIPANLSNAKLGIWRGQNDFTKEETP